MRDIDECIAELERKQARLDYWLSFTYIALPVANLCLAGWFVWWHQYRTALWNLALAAFNIGYARWLGRLTERRRLDHVAKMAEFDCAHALWQKRMEKEFDE